jgi:hypothetical protein
MYAIKCLEKIISLHQCNVQAPSDPDAKKEVDDYHLPQGRLISPSPGGELNVTICGTDSPASTSSSASSSSPQDGRAHGEIGNPSAADGGGGAGGGAVGRRCVRRCGCGSGMGEPVREAGVESARCGGGT